MPKKRCLALKEHPVVGFREAIRMRLIASAGLRVNEVGRRCSLGDFAPCDWETAPFHR
jgi:hypothetical protein